MIESSGNLLRVTALCVEVDYPVEDRLFAVLGTEGFSSLAFSLSLSHAIPCAA
jgi:hypothetical protein